VLLLGAGSTLLLLPIVQEREWGSWKWWLLVVAAIVLTAFVLWEIRYQKRGKEPLVDLTLYKRPSYSFGSAMITIYFAGFTPLFFVFTLLLQTGLKYSALAAGLAVTPFALGSAAAAPLGGRIVERFGRVLVAAGLVLVAVGLAGSVLAVHEVPTSGTGLATLAPLLVAGFGSGLVITPNQTLTLSQVPVERAGTAGGLLQTGQRVGAAVGIAAVGSAFFAREASSMATSSGNSHANTASAAASAYQVGILVAGAFVVAALVLAVVDIATNRRRERAGSPRSAAGN
jgi:MFS family permease